jgi:hypothetical protein
VRGLVLKFALGLISEPILYTSFSGSTLDAWCISLTHKINVVSLIEEAEAYTTVFGSQSAFNDADNVEVVYKMESVVRKRKTKMNKHKRRKRMKKQRFLMQRIGRK